MFKVTQPFFQVDTQTWDDMFTEEVPVNDDQPEEESETETEEETESTEEADQVDETEEESETDSEEEDSTDESEPAFNDETEIELGEGRQAVKLSELKSGYLRQSDYTKKTQALADERKAFESEREELEPLRGMNDFLQSNPWLNQQISQFIKEFAETGSVSLDEALQDAAYGQHLNVWMARATKAEKELDSYKSKYEEMEFTGSMRDLESQLKADYGDLVTPEYISSLKERAKADKLPTSVLKEIADGHLGKLQLEQAQKEAKKTKKEAEAKTYQRLAEKRESLPAQPKKTGQVPRDAKATDPLKPMEWNDIFD